MDIIVMYVKGVVFFNFLFLMIDFGLRRIVFLFDVVRFYNVNM